MPNDDSREDSGIKMGDSWWIVEKVQAVNSIAEIGLSTF